MREHAMSFDAVRRQRDIHDLTPGSTFTFLYLSSSTYRQDFHIVIFR